LLCPKIDLRVTVIGESVYAVQITDSGRGIDGDWRLLGKEHLKYDDYMLPADERQRCIALVANLDLKFADIDLALTQDGIHFIEINPTGEWSWLDCASRPIAADIALMLSEAAGI
jgi:glutathione synthase/RimK-type ligase-like ATP-grasp enzyme